MIYLSLSSVLQVLKIFPLSPPPGAHSWRLYSAEFKLLCPLKNIQFLTKIEEAEAGNQDELLFNVTNMGHATGRCLNVSLCCCVFE